MRKWISGGAIVAVVGAFATGCFAMVPTRSELGIAWADGQAPQTRLGTGVALASLVSPTTTRVEVAAGAFIESGKAAAASPQSFEYGIYADAAYAVVQREHIRLLAGLRAEQYWHGLTEWAGKARVDFELVTRSARSLTSEKYASTGRAAGNVAIGLYVEAGRASMVDRDAWLASGGLTFRLPAFAIKLHGDGGTHGFSWSPDFKSWKGRN